ncbi:MAG TPA: rRNA maturation RNase YbeY [bacterium]|jgi:probable rRNA maturation factor|nr:rRNA maturation RNase YbeY [bacterium]HNZ51198.1 rRNA maturation RNase YbeY [bacterium]HOF79534.1 rRNA maturation RNase YbeY [bacterium]HOH85093.1 rRNA maturation RNase YbeY [bacterium]HOQ91658.1 rRNA maturation RNase YbeY [bacterium]
MVTACNLTKQNIDLDRWQKISQLFLQEQQADGDISLVLVGDRRIRHLNNQYRHRDQTTDVLSFTGDGDGQLGEIMVNYQQITRQARRFGHSTWRELIFITTHGILHLLGYDDDTDGGWQVMEKISQEFVEKYKIC